MTERLDFDVVTQAGMTQKEFARLCGVDRVTVNLWVRGKMQPHKFIRDNIVTLLSNVSAAVQAQKLPLPEGTPHAKRQDLIDAIMAPAKATA